MLRKCLNLKAKPSRVTKRRGDGEQIRSKWVYVNIPKLYFGKPLTRYTQKWNWECSDRKTLTQTKWGLIRRKCKVSVPWLAWSMLRPPCLSARTEIYENTLTVIPGVYKVSLWLSGSTNIRYKSGNSQIVRLTKPWCLPQNFLSVNTSIVFWDP